jgi:hypothetical protein
MARICSNRFKDKSVGLKRAGKGEVYFSPLISKLNNSVHNQPTNMACIGAKP